MVRPAEDSGACPSPDGGPLRVLQVLRVRMSGLDVEAEALAQTASRRREEESGWESDGG